MDQNQKQEGGEKSIKIFHAIVVLLMSALVGYFVYTNASSPEAKYPFKLGLDLAGGSHLVYEADVSKISPEEVPVLMNVLRDVIENRVNVFGVSEPIVYLQSSSFVSEEQSERLVVELPGVTDVEEAVAEIGRTPQLEFKLIDQEALAAINSAQNLETNMTENASGSIGIGNIEVNGQSVDDINPYIDTGLTGRYLTGASLEFAGGQAALANEPIVSIVFDSEGAELFEEITRDNIGENLAIFLDGTLISAPRLNETISGGRAIISGGFAVEEARALADNLKLGALPVPISLASTQTIGATLGGEVLGKGVTAGLLGLGLVIGFMVLWYRALGVVAGIALVTYVLMMLAVFMLVPVTLTAAGLAGFILSLGMAVDANVLVFERMKENYRKGESSHKSASEGFTRAWGAIRDGNVTSLLSAGVLFWFGTSMVKGFALVFGIGVFLSMLSALVVTRTLLLSLPETSKREGSLWSKLLDSGLKF